MVNLANVSTVILSIAAILAGILAYKNIQILKTQRRIDTFLSLIDQVLSQRERDNRHIVDRLWIARQPYEGLREEPDIGKRIAKLIDDARYSEGIADASKSAQIGIHYKEAVEEVIDCFDKVGFFLLGHPPQLKVDARLKNEAPVWVWTITLHVWDKLGAYVKGVQTGSFERKNPEDSKAIPQYGRFFESLKDEAVQKMQRR